MKLAEWKSQNGHTDESLAALIGDCSASSIQKWLRGERIPREEQMLRIFEVTKGDVTPNDFYQLPEGPASQPAEVAG